MRRRSRSHAVAAALSEDHRRNRCDPDSGESTVTPACCETRIECRAAGSIRIRHRTVLWTTPRGLATFGTFTMFDVDQLRRAGAQDAVPIAASIFLDIFNVFLLFLQLFCGKRD